MPAVLIGAFGTPAFAQYFGQQEQQADRTLSVTGFATEKVSPDDIFISLSVETRNTTVTAALAANSHTMGRVISALNSTGVPPNNISTSQLGITPIISEPTGIAPGIITSYDVMNTIQITLSNSTSVSTLIDTAVGAGANRLGGVQFKFSPSKSKEIEDALIKEAVADARARADLVASAAGVTINGIKSIGINAGMPGPYYGPLGLALPLEADHVNTPIMAGQREFSVSANVVYLIS